MYNACLLINGQDKVAPSDLEQQGTSTHSLDLRPQTSDALYYSCPDRQLILTSPPRGRTKPPPEYITPSILFLSARLLPIKLHNKPLYRLSGRKCFFGCQSLAGLVVCISPVHTPITTEN
ncbi:hypothetical protein J6590_081720 [Homalodisca vitripennis]|nr:hypothetical protein J6590_081720 [Homalodisca vitripennis]